MLRLVCGTLRQNCLVPNVSRNAIPLPHCRHMESSWNDYYSIFSDSKVFFAIFFCPRRQERGCVDVDRSTSFDRHKMIDIEWLMGVYFVGFMFAYSALSLMSEAEMCTRDGDVEGLSWHVPTGWWWLRKASFHPLRETPIFRRLQRSRRNSAPSLRLSTRGRSAENVGCARKRFSHSRKSAEPTSSTSVPPPVQVRSVGTS